MSSRKPFKKCILHIGTEKTGSTTIQEYLKSNRDALAKHGAYHPIAADTEHSSQWEFVAVVHHAPWTQDTGRELGIIDKASQEAFRETLSEKLDAEFARPPKICFQLRPAEANYNPTIALIPAIKDLVWHN